MPLQMHVIFIDHQNERRRHKLQQTQFEAELTTKLEFERAMRQRAQAEVKLESIKTENSFRISFASFEQISSDSLRLVN